MITEEIAPGAFLLRGFALAGDSIVRNELARIEAAAPFRNMVTPGGFRMSVAMTNCGAWGWIADRRGYRYESRDPESGEPWPAMPPSFLELAGAAARAAAFGGFSPDACLINRYQPGSKLSLHQDKNERDYDQPIVSVSLGLGATFQFGGFERAEPIQKIRLEHGDVVVWGGPARLRYHGVLTLKAGTHPWLGSYRVNLTFRRAA
ncbi:MAG TPA: DNA oxidative demethylase AlkB [Terriglobales bacterium]|jgi:alkylated DNA repair protein (DNA oxidative demethylase)